MTGSAGGVTIGGGAATGGSGVGGSLTLRAGTGVSSMGSVLIDDGTGTVLQVQAGALTQGSKLGSIDLTAFTGSGTGVVNFVGQGASSFAGAGVDIKTTAAAAPVRVYSGAIAAATSNVEIFTGQPTGSFAAGTVSISGGDGGTTGGAGGNVVVQGGAGAAGNANGGSVSLVGASGSGTGAGGDIDVTPGTGATEGTFKVHDSGSNTVIQAGSSGVALGKDATYGVATMVWRINDLGSGTTATVSTTYGSGYTIYKTTGSTLTFTISGAIPDGTELRVLCANAGGCTVSPMATGGDGTVAQGRIGSYIVVSSALYSLN